MEGWHEFYGVLGGAAATLVGLTFVSVSIRTGSMTEEERPKLRVYLSPLIAHLAEIVVAALIVLMPIGPESLFRTLAACGLAGLLYASAILWRMTLLDHDLDDLIVYGWVPVVCHLVFVAGAALLIARIPVGPFVVAGALLALLLTSIRNAWDIAVWAAMTTRTGR